MLQQHNLSTQQRFKKRERTQNWAYEEKRFLLELCRKDMHIVENKRLDSALTSLKNRAWKIIHQQFALTFGTDRNCNRLKEQWRRMKACTRAEMLDYQHRVSRYGQEVADKKRPTQFTFEIWEFMQEAKKACRNELMDDVDYSKVKLSLEENLPNGIIVKEDMDEEEEEEDADHDGDNMMWEKTSQNICEVQITEESPDDEDDGRNNMLQISRIRTSNSALSSSSSGEPPHKQSRHSLAYLNTGDNKNFMKNNAAANLPALSINNMAATLDTLNLLKNQFNYNLVDSNILRNNNNNNNNINNNNSNLNNNNNLNVHSIAHDDNNAADKLLMQMKKKEHSIRMEILQTELETAKINRDCAELNKQLALKRLSDSLKFSDS